MSKPFFLQENLPTDLGINYEAGETLHEMAVVYKDAKSNMMIAVNPDRNRNLQGEAYFKVYNAFSYDKATKLARIKFESPEYVIHSNSDGKKVWFLNAQERKKLVEMLSKIISHQLDDEEKLVKITRFQQTIIQFNKDGFDIRTERETYEKKNKEGLMIDIPMPDYMELRKEK